MIDDWLPFEKKTWGSFRMAKQKTRRIQRKKQRKTRQKTQRGGQTQLLKRNSGSMGSRSLINRESTRNALELIDTYKNQGMTYNQMRSNLYEIEMTNPQAQKITSAARRILTAEESITA
jgi:hypothetical protein